MASKAVKQKTALKKIIRSTRRSVKHVAQSLLYKQGTSAPVFLTGCGRSGTNFLANRLGRTLQIRLYNETDTNAFENWRLKNPDVIQKLIQKSHAPVLLFKPINDSYRMSPLLYYYRESKIIFQFRHYNDVVNSIIRGPFGERKSLVKYWISSNFDEFKLHPPSQNTQGLIRSLYNDSLNDESGSALYWLLQNKFIIDQNLYCNPRVKLIQYESMIQKPEQRFRELCSFINIQYKDKMLNGLKSSSISKNKDPKISENIQIHCENLWSELCQNI